jgi:nucleoside phosphorylase
MLFSMLAAGPGGQKYLLDIFAGVRVPSRQPTLLLPMPSAKLIWKVFASCENISLSTHRSELYEVRTGKALLRQIGGDINPTFFPLVLEPKSVFFSKLTPAARAAGMRGTKTIFTLDLPKIFNAPSTEIRSIFGLHLYERHICVSIELDRFKISKETDLLLLQDLSSHPALLAVARKIIEIVSRPAMPSEQAPQPLKIYPCLQIIADEDETALSEQELVRVLTRHSAPNQVLVAAVVAKNRLHQIDTTQTLLDRQGLVSYVPFSATAGEKEGNDRRFRSCSAMLELAAAGQRIMRDKIAPTDAQLDTMRPMIVGLPRATMPNSTSAQRAWSLLLDEFNLVRTFDDLVETKRVSAVDVKKDAPEFVVPLIDLKSIDVVENTTILCVAAATVELSAIHRYLSVEFGEAAQVALDGGEDYALQYTDPLSKARWFVVTLSFQGQSEAALEVRNLSHLIKPTILLMVGMCMGIPSKGLKVGTVVVPNEVTVFDHERLTASGIEYRPHGDRVDNGLYKLARILGASEKLTYRVVTDKGLASASRKIEDPGAILMGVIQKTFQDVAAYDMEGWGFYRAGAGQQCLWIKAVADSGEAPAPGSSGQEAKHGVQSVSTDNAIAFAILLVRRKIALNSK